MDPPANGTAIEVAPGILWMRLPLPIRLNHINIYLFEDDGGWTIFDTGMNDAACRMGWENVLGGALSGRPIRRLVASHFHYDHVGLAGWLHERFAPEFLMSQTEYLLSRMLESERSDKAIARQTKFFVQSGLGLSASSIAHGRSERMRYQTPLPERFDRLRAGDFIRIGNRDWKVLTGGGHGVEQIMLYCATDQIFISADQVLPEITPNISVGAIAPNDNPLRDFLQSLDEVRSEVGDEAFVLPGHRRPFYGLHQRIGELKRHHESRCEIVLKACRERPLTSAELVPLIFERTLGPDVIGSAIGEAVAHTNFLVRERQLTPKLDCNGVTYRTI